MNQFSALSIAVALATARVAQITHDLMQPQTPEDKVLRERNLETVIKAREELIKLRDSFVGVK